MYGVIANFDHKTEQYIKELWMDLSVSGISRYAEEVADRRPHLTLASYNDVNVDEFIKKMDEYYTGSNPINVTFSVLGTFLNSGTMFLSPTLTKELLNFHQQHHEKFAMFNDNLESMYAPGRWVPHCTIANRLSPNKLTEAFGFCSNKIKTINAQITEITLIETIYEDGKCVSAPTVYTKKLIFK